LTKTVLKLKGSFPPFLVLFACVFLTVTAFGISRAEAGRERVTSGVSRMCDSTRPRTDVSALTTKTRYIRTKSAFKLTAMHGMDGRNITLGLGGGEIGYETHGKFKVMEQDGEACVSLDQVRVKFYAKPQVHIASNFKRGSCEYNAVLGHEQKHIRTLRRFHKEYAQALKKKLPEIAGKVKPSGVIPASQVEYAQNRMLEQVAAGVEAYLSKAVGVLGRRQGHVDSPSEYRRVFALCDNWNEQIANGN
jgi:hypothetical protein